MEITYAGTSSCKRKLFSLKSADHERCSCVVAKKRFGIDMGSTNSVFKAGCSSREFPLRDACIRSCNCFDLEGPRLVNDDTDDYSNEIEKDNSALLETSFNSWNSKTSHIACVTSDSHNAFSANFINESSNVFKKSTISVPTYVWNESDSDTDADIDGFDSIEGKIDANQSGNSYQMNLRYSSMSRFHRNVCVNSLSSHSFNVTDVTASTTCCSSSGISTSYNTSRKHSPPNPYMGDTSELNEFVDDDTDSGISISIEQNSSSIKPLRKLKSHAKRLMMKSLRGFSLSKSSLASSLQEILDSSVVNSIKKMKTFLGMNSGIYPKSRKSNFQNDLSDNSLFKCECKWPIPWLELIFLPEFTSKSLISLNDLTLLNRIGFGSFGTVYRASINHQPQVLLALKIQQKSEILCRSAENQIKNEVLIHRKVQNSPFIAILYNCWQTRAQLYTLMEYVAGYGDLFTVWNDYGPFDDDSIKVIAAEIAIALDYIHRGGIVYRDLKLENIVLDIDRHIKLVDFGFAKVLENGEQTRTICGTLQYMAPEISKGLSYGIEVDWWSFGVLLYLLVSGRFPFPNSNVSSHEQLSFDGYFNPSCNKHCADLINKLLGCNVDRRLKSFEGIKFHPYFGTLNWNNILERKEEPFFDLKRCQSCNSVSEDDAIKTGSYFEDGWSIFDEDYEFADGSYFCDVLF